MALSGKSRYDFINIMKKGCRLKECHIHPNGRTLEHYFTGKPYGKPGNPHTMMTLHFG
jgi:hypothetical protein